VLPEHPPIHLSHTNTYAALDHSVRSSPPFPPSVMDTFVHDPLVDWVKGLGGGRASGDEGCDNPYAKDALATIEGAGRRRRCGSGTRSRVCWLGSRECFWGGSSAPWRCLRCVEHVPPTPSRFPPAPTHLPTHPPTGPATGRLKGTLLGVSSKPCMPLSAEGHAHRLIEEATDKVGALQAQPECRSWV
jgi:hypothetical protein